MANSMASISVRTIRIQIMTIAPMQTEVVYISMVDEALHLRPAVGIIHLLREAKCLLSPPAAG